MRGLFGEERYIDNLSYEKYYLDAREIQENWLIISPSAATKPATKKERREKRRGKKEREKDKGGSIPKTSSNMLPLHYDSVLNVRYRFRLLSSALRRLI